jgi:hypothetical protein
LRAVTNKGKTTKETHSIYFLVSTAKQDYIDPFLIALDKKISIIPMPSYKKADVKEYIYNKCKIDNKAEFAQKANLVCSVCPSDLSLVDFLITVISNNTSNLDTLDKFVTYRLDDIKKEGRERQLSDSELEDVILSAAFSIQSFSSKDISAITSRAINETSDCLDLAKEKTLIDKDDNCLFNYISESVRDALACQGIVKRKERLMYYYQYYTEHEQDNYYCRGNYLARYFEQLTPQAFCLLALSCITSKKMQDQSLEQKTKDIVYEFCNAEQKEQYEKIESFCNLLATDCTISDLEKAYIDISNQCFEIPLMAEISCLMFHKLYTKHEYDCVQIKRLFSTCMQYILNGVKLSYFLNPIKIVPCDETIIRLMLIYTLAPYVIDVQNDTDQFMKLYDLSEKLRVETKTLNAKGIATYMHNIFNRKAFLYRNQAMCDVYYDEAKQYFRQNEIWGEYYKTLICQAGTNIVIGQYDKALSYCKDAQSVLKKHKLSLEQHKEINNNAIADFFVAEKAAKNYVERKAAAEKCISILCGQLSNVQSPTEDVILTNICSLALYCDDEKSYLKYKKKLNSLLKCSEVSDIFNENINDFYRYYFAWFELYLNISSEKWSEAEKRLSDLQGFIPALFRDKQTFLDSKFDAARQIVATGNRISAYDFCTNLVETNRREVDMAKFFWRGLMLSDLQYTSD